ncbi:MAG: MFS transporter [Sporichthyaceae bacterium]|nr:MFS transporter [Sporichthyaceae bacterium]
MTATVSGGAELETPAPVTPQNPPQAPLRADPNFRRYWSARSVSLVGASMTFFALPQLVYQLSNESSFATGLLVAVQAVPYVLFGLVAGALADRLDRRRIMVTADLLNAAVLGSVPVAAAFGALTLPHAMAVGMFGATLFVFFDAANFGALPTLVGRDRIAAANGAVMGAGSVVEIGVPSLTGLLISVVHPSSVLALAALTAVASALFVRAITRPLSDPDRAPGALTARRLRSEIADGLRYLWNHPTIRPMTFVGMLQSVAGGAAVGQFVPYLDRALGVVRGDWRFGLMFSVHALGGLVAAMLVRRVAARFGAVRVVLYGLPVSASFGIAYALAPNWWLAMTLLGCWAAAYMLVVINGITYRQQVTPEHLLSRVNVTGRMLAWGIGWTVGGLLGGVVSTAFDPRAGTVAGAGALVVALIVAWLSPLRRAAGVTAIPAGVAGRDDQPG